MSVAERFDLRVAGDDRAWAWLSRDGSYRYGLGRRWHPTHAPMTVCMLNPSTADERVVDPTVRKLLHFAQRDGHGGLVVVNLFALRSADPSYMVDWIAEGRDPVGPANDAAIDALLSRFVPVAAWGAFSHKFIRERAAAVMAMRPRWQCFGTTKDGHPKHPCYLPNATSAEAWR